MSAGLEAALAPKRPAASLPEPPSDRVDDLYADGLVP
jgi:hypothetical protein